jgi:hypothetical protein
MNFLGTVVGSIILISFFGSMLGVCVFLRAVIPSIIVILLGLIVYGVFFFMLFARVM